MSSPRFLLSCALAVVGLSAAHAASYSVIDLGVANGWSSRATGVNNSGQVVGNIFHDIHSDGAYTYTAFSYSSATGSMSSLRYDTPNPEPGGSIRHHNSWAYAINNNGQIAGAIDTRSWTEALATTFGGPPTATVRNPNGSIDYFPISAPSGSLDTESIAYAINQAGEITGNRIPSGVGSMGYSTFIDGYFIGLGNNDLGQQVGYEYGGFTTRLCTAGVWTTIANTLSAENSGRARDINNHGVVVGNAMSITGPQAYRYTAAGGMVQLATTFGGQALHTSEANAINDNGWIVGTAAIAGNYRAFLYTDSLGMLDLNTLLTNSSNLTLTSATAISENGYIAGYGISSVDGQEHAFLLAPPIANGAPDAASTFGLMALALTGLAAVRRRRAQG